MYDFYQNNPERTGNISNDFNKLPYDFNQIDNSRVNYNYDPNFNLDKVKPMPMPMKETELFIIYKVKPNDNIYDIARRHGVDYKEVLALNGLDEKDYIYPGQEIMLPRKMYNTYTIKEGETLEDIARMLGVTEEHIISQNKKIYLLPKQPISY